MREVSVRQIQHAQSIVPIVSVQNRYSVIDRGSEDVLEYCEKEKTDFFPWFPRAAQPRIRTNCAPVLRQFRPSAQEAFIGWLKGSLAA
jgi:pyridoxine 4-dehydrogenase